MFSARPKFEPSEDFVQVVLCSLRLLGSVVGTRFAVCFDRDHAFSLYLCCGRVWTSTGSSTFVKVILIIQGLGSAFELGCFHRPYLNGLQYGSGLTGFESRACPWLVQIGWPLVYPTVSLGLLRVTHHGAWFMVERLVVYACLTCAESSCLAEG